MLFKTPILLSTAALLALTACVDPNAFPDDPNVRTRNGAILGGLVGAAAGASSGEDKLEKAVIGGVIGAFGYGHFGYAFSLPLAAILLTLALIRR